MKVVSNTGPLVALGKLQRLDLLEKLYGEILIPDEVEDEINIGVRERRAHALAIAKMVREGKLRVVGISSEAPPFELPIDAGESESIILALQEKAVLILIDDLDGREEAERLGLHFRGTIGIILDAFERNILSERETKDLLEKARKRRDIWISKKITEAAIQSVNKRRK